MSQLIIYLMAFGSGLVAPLAFAPFSYGLVMLLSLAALIALIPHAKRPALLGFSYGLGWFGFGINWVHISMESFGGMPLIASLFLMLLLAGYLALYPALACWLISRWRPQQGLAYYLLWIPGCWLFIELLRAWMLTGFPWLQAGYSQINTPLAGFASILGVYGVTWLSMICAACMVMLCRAFILHRYFAGMLLAMIMMTGAALNHVSWTQAQEPLKVSLVQGNIDLNQKWLSSYRQPTIDLYRELSFEQSDSDVVIWPESAIPAFEINVVEALRLLDREFKQRDQALITGLLSRDHLLEQHYNSLLVLGQQQQNQAQPSYHYQHDNRYNKQQLLPIGEFVPFEDLLRPLAPFFNLPMSSFDRGSSEQSNLQVKGHQWVAAICYEIAFGELLRASMNDDTDTIITVSNDAWFGDSMGPAQHLEIAQMRAREFNRPVVRSTNTGHTAIIDRFGKITALAPTFEALNLTAEITPALGSTPYQRWGLMPLWAVLLLCGIAGLVNAYQGRKSQSK